MKKAIKVLEEKEKLEVKEIHQNWKYKGNYQLLDSSKHKII